jgi:hypothetical protein
MVSMEIFFMQVNLGCEYISPLMVSKKIFGLKYISPLMWVRIKFCMQVNFSAYGKHKKCFVCEYISLLVVSTKKDLDESTCHCLWWTQKNIWDVSKCFMLSHKKNFGMQSHFTAYGKNDKCFGCEYIPLLMVSTINSFGHKYISPLMVSTKKFLDASTSDCLWWAPKNICDVSTCHHLWWPWNKGLDASTFHCLYGVQKIFFMQVYFTAYGEHEKMLWMQVNLRCEYISLIMVKS